MKLGRLNHVGVATPTSRPRSRSGATRWARRRSANRSTCPSKGVRVCFVDTPDGGTQIELLAPLVRRSPIAAFLQRNPLGGQHHLAFEVPDIQQAHQEFTALGKRILGPIRIGRARDAGVLRAPGRTWPACLTEIMEGPAHG
jgi:methylmalonyl-CoA/ethylmalonyl-CoA epimerase